MLNLPRFTLPRLPERAMHWLILRHALLRHAVVMGVRMVVIDSGGQVLLVRHSYLPGWHLPGGGCEIGETVRAAAIREVREEAGLAISGEPALLGIYLNRALGNRNHVAVFVTRDFVVIPDAPRDWEIIERGFFAPAALPEATTPGTRARLAEALDGVRPRETW